MEQPTKVKRYNDLVWESSMDLQRQQCCLCFSCDRMKPGDPEHCEAAQKFYQVCVDYNCAFIMTRCRDWEPKEKTDQGES